MRLRTWDEAPLSLLVERIRCSSFKIRILSIK